MAQYKIMWFESDRKLANYAYLNAIDVRALAQWCNYWCVRNKHLGRTIKGAWTTNETHDFVEYVHFLPDEILQQHFIENYEERLLQFYYYRQRTIPDANEWVQRRKRDDWRRINN